MPSNLQPVVITDRNGVQTTRWKKHDGSPKAPLSIPKLTGIKFAMGIDRRSFISDKESQKFTDYMREIDPDVLELVRDAMSGGDDFIKSHLQKAMRDNVALGIPVEATEREISYSALLLPYVCRLASFSGDRQVILSNTLLNLKHLPQSAIEMSNETKHQAVGRCLSMGLHNVDVSKEDAIWLGENAEKIIAHKERLSEYSYFDRQFYESLLNSGSYSLSKGYL